MNKTYECPCADCDNIDCTEMCCTLCLWIYDGDNDCDVCIGDV